MRKFKLYIFTLLLSMLSPAVHAEITAALIAPQSGELKVWGDELLYGVQTAIDEINQSGGLNGKRVNLLIVDDPCSENLSISTAQMLALKKEQKPALVIGPYCSQGFDKTSAIYANAKIFQIIPVMLNAVYAEKTYKGLIKITGVKEQIGEDFFNFYNKRFAGKSVALVFNPENRDNIFQAQAILDEFQHHGKASLIQSYLYTNDPDEISKTLQKDNSEIVFLLGKAKKVAKTIRDLKRRNKDIIIFTSKYMTGDSLNRYAQDYLDNVYFMGMPPVENNPDFAEQIVKLRLHGINFKGLNIYGYSAVKTWANLAKKSKSLNFDKIAQTAKKSELRHIWSNASVQKTDENNTLHYVFFNFKKGEFVLAE